MGSCQRESGPFPGPLIGESAKMALKEIVLLLFTNDVEKADSRNLAQAQQGKGVESSAQPQKVNG